MREIKFEFIIKSNDKKHLSAPYTLEEILQKDDSDILEDMESCDCQLNEIVNHCEGDCIRFEEAEIIGKRQFLGIKDKNLKEFYEGDILRVKFLDSNFKEVEYIVFVKAYKCEYRLFLNEDSQYSKLDIVCNNSGHYEIIGNIFEDPDLIKQKK